MAQLQYDTDGRLLFTEEMRKEYTCLVPQMLPIHFSLLKHAFDKIGIRAEILTSTNQDDITSLGQKYVHNDICYPAILVVGQILEALQSGNYDTDKVALLLTQTGGGCRDSNYISLLRKALKKANLEHIPVVSLNIPAVEKNPGFKPNISFSMSAFASVAYGDALMWAYNRTRAHEINKGDSYALLMQLTDKLAKDISQHNWFSLKHVKKQLQMIMTAFDEIPMHITKKVKVGIVGEIYAKYAPLGNNKLEEFLLAENAEVVISGVMDFVLAVIVNRREENNIFGKLRWQNPIISFTYEYVLKFQNALIEACKKTENIPAPAPFKTTRDGALGYVSHGNHMGEGWLLTAEMLELIHGGVNNIICAQPFGCLANHISGRGMIKKIKENYPQANIVAIDYDPGFSKANQENRIRLMLESAKEVI